MYGPLNSIQPYLHRLSVSGPNCMWRSVRTLNYCNAKDFSSVETRSMTSSQRTESDCRNIRRFAYQADTSVSSAHRHSVPYRLRSQTGLPNAPAR
jgi:hypothetical protein